MIHGFALPGHNVIQTDFNGVRQFQSTCCIVFSAGNEHPHFIKTIAAI
jgi:hypothetical protein